MNQMKFFILLILLTITSAWATKEATKGSETKWDDRKHCINPFWYSICRIGMADGFCTYVCKLRGWTNGQCRHRRGQTGITGYVVVGPLKFKSQTNRIMFFIPC
ncbi:unnamed protein product [Lactuca virosa]|uniref:Uncharacterized protein n=1 Tax=Lactuca virosa TaxID=75947 RepID=A0AAU9P836_9ASTR|nr:unnamed protein product [Lactuca virosa]